MGNNISCQWHQWKKYNQTDSLFFTWQLLLLQSHYYKCYCFWQVYFPETGVKKIIQRREACRRPCFFIKSRAHEVDLQDEADEQKEHMTRSTCHDLPLVQVVMRLKCRQKKRQPQTSLWPKGIEYHEGRQCTWHWQLFWRMKMRHSSQDTQVLK